MAADMAIRPSARSEDNRRKSSLVKIRGVLKIAGDLCAAAKGAPRPRQAPEDKALSRAFIDLHRHEPLGPLLKLLLSRPFRRNLAQAELLERDGLVARFLSHHDRLKAATLLPQSFPLAAILVRVATPLEKASMPNILPLAADPVRLGAVTSALQALEGLAQAGDASARIAQATLDTWREPLVDFLAVDAEVTARGISRIAPDGTPIPVSDVVRHRLAGRL